jgi:hypothetical protein
MIFFIFFCGPLKEPRSRSASGTTGH